MNSYTKHDYIKLLNEMKLDKDPNYPRNDIGVAKLFFEMHRDTLTVQLLRQILHD